MTKKVRKPVDPDAKASVSEQIVTLIRMSEMKQVELSAKTGINRTRISKILSNEANPSTKEIDTFAAFFGYRLAKVVEEGNS